LYLARLCWRANTNIRPADSCYDRGTSGEQVTCGLDFIADCIGIVSPISQEGLNPVGYHAEQRSEALHIVGLPRCQHEAEREASGIASGMELGGEAVSRSAKRLGLLSPLFMSTAQ
jgi:hypothetical protein